MTEKITSIARNTSYFTLALVIQKIISLTYFTMYARVLGPSDLGQYYFAISITSIFSIFIDWGLSNILTREVAKQPEKAQTFLGSIISLKLIFALLTAGALLIWTQSWPYESLTRDLIYISGLIIIFDNFTAVFYAILRGYHNLKFESIASVLFQTIVLVLSLIFIGLHLDIRWLMCSLLGGSLFNVIYSGLMMKRVTGLQLRTHWDKAVMKQVFLLALPFAVYGIFQRFYTFFDSVLLFKFAGDTAVGLYQVPFKIIVAIQFLPMAFTASLYPALSAYWQRNREQLQVTFERAINYSLILAIPITIGTIVLAEHIVSLFTTDFNDAILPLQVAITAVPAMFVTFPIGSLLNACDRQTRNTVNIAITSIVSALLNWWLIPRWGVLGACITSVITSAGMVVLCWLVVPSIITVRTKALLLMIGRIMLAGLLMGGFVYLVKNILHPVITVGLASLVYAAILYLVRGFQKEDIMSLMKSFRKV